jgi:hypothetical protein
MEGSPINQNARARSNTGKRPTLVWGVMAEVAVTIVSCLPDLLLELLL